MPYLFQSLSIYMYPPLLSTQFCFMKTLLQPFFPLSRPLLKSPNASAFVDNPQSISFLSHLWTSPIKIMVNFPLAFSNYLSHPIVIFFFLG